jgi:DNA modification methylase
MEFTLSPDAQSGRLHGPMNTKHLSLRPIHPFPARMAPSIVQQRLKSRKALRVLDPMAGSGTTIVAARLFGHRALGFDTDPLALLIAKASSSDVDPEHLRSKASKILSEAQKRYRDLSLGDAYPKKADPETRAFIRFWFDPTNRRQLAALSAVILKVKDTTERTFLWCSFSRLIVTKDAGASLAIDVSHSRPHRAYTIAPVRPFEQFLTAVEKVLRASHFSTGKTLPSASIDRADARDLPPDDESIDLVVTSPPYLNAIDYLRGHKLSLVWMGHRIKEIRELRSQNIGSEISRLSTLDADHIRSALKSMCNLKKLSRRSQGMLAQYVHDMDFVLAEISRVLKNKGEAVIVVGNSTIRGVFIKNSRALTYLARANGLRLDAIRRRRLPENRRYLPPPGKRISGKLLRSRMTQEVILTFGKIKASVHC